MSPTSIVDLGDLPLGLGAGDAGDPAMARDDATGRLYLATLSGNRSHLLVFRSDDGGQTWQPPVNGTPGSPGFIDKPRLAVDNSAAAGPGRGTVYVVGKSFDSPGAAGPGTDAIYLWRSTDGGATWATPDAPLASTGVVSDTGQGAFPVVAPNHSVSVFWYHPRAGVE